MNSNYPDTLSELGRVLRERRGATPDSSYVASLYSKGLNKILEKVGEEAVEVILAAKDYDSERDADKRQALVGEVADLWFHSMVALAHLGLGPDEVLAELERRFGFSGLAEKAARQSSHSKQEKN